MLELSWSRSSSNMLWVHLCLALRRTRKERRFTFYVLIFVAAYAILLVTSRSSECETRTKWSTGLSVPTLIRLDLAIAYYASKQVLGRIREPSNPLPRPKRMTAYFQSSNCCRNFPLREGLATGPGDFFSDDTRRCCLEMSVWISCCRLA